MKKNVKRLLLGVLVGAMSVFTVVASGCSATDKVEGWFNQLTCEHAKVEKVVGKDATCTEDGYTEHEVCKDCDKELGKKVIKATGHENITVIEGYAATCTMTGKTDAEYCNDCKKTVVESKTIYALGHKKTYARAEEETCTTDGHTEGWICGNDGCGYVYSGYELIPATGHDFSQTNICADCGERQETILLSELKESMDLSGYSIRLNISEKEFEENFVSLDDPLDPAPAYCVTGLGFDSFVITFMKFGFDEYSLSLDIGYGIALYDFSTGSLQKIPAISIDPDDGSVLTHNPIILDERCSSIRFIEGGSAEALDYIEFYYVGLD